MMPFSVPVIDLDEIGGDEQLVLALGHILKSFDTFVLKNYANYNTLKEWVLQLAERPPDDESEFNKTFTGVYMTEGLVVQQNVYGVQQTFDYPYMQRDELFNRVSSRLHKVAIYFAKVCLEALGCSHKKESVFNKKTCSTVATRYYDGSASSSELQGLKFEYYKEAELFQPKGILAAFAIAKDAQVMHNGKWHQATEEDGVLIHTGDLLTTLSEGKHVSSPLRILKSSEMVRFMIGPSFDYLMEDGSLFGDVFLRQQIELYPQTAERYHLAEMNRIKLEKAVAAVKLIYQVSMSILTLHKMNHPTSEYIELDRLLWQIGNMNKCKVTESEFLKALTITPDAYKILFSEDNTIKVETPDNLLMDSQRRCSHFNFAATRWLNQMLKEDLGTAVPEIPPFKLTMPKNCKTLKSYNGLGGKYRSGSLKSLRGIAKSEPKDSISSAMLLERIRNKERRAAALLVERQQQRQKYLKVKMKQVFGIIITLEAQKPYTTNYLCSLIVDSLRDSNNPVGTKEVETVLTELSNMLVDDINVVELPSNMLVYKWKPLTQSKFDERLQNWTAPTSTL